MSTEMVELGAGIAASIAAGGFAIDRYISRPFAIYFAAGALSVVGAGTMLLLVLHLHVAPVAAQVFCTWGP